MADGFSAEVRVDPPDLFRGALNNRVFEAARVAMEGIGSHAAERAQANAPIKSGDLRRSIRHRIIVRGRIITAKIIASEPYALRMHEELDPAGTLQLGPLSRAQPGTPEGGVGGKYIERVVNHHVVTYLKHLRATVKSGLSRKQARRVTVRRINTGT